MLPLRRRQVMDAHLEKLCTMHMETKFVRVRALARPAHTHAHTTKRRCANHQAAAAASLRVSPTLTKPHTHLHTRRAQIDAEKSPFLVEKLKVWMLPTLALIRSEKTVDYLVGLDELGGRDDFSTETLRVRLAAAGVVNYEAGGGGAGGAGRGGGGSAAPQRSMRSGATRDAGDEDSDFDD